MLTIRLLQLLLVSSIISAAISQTTTCLEDDFEHDLKFFKVICREGGPRPFVVRDYVDGDGGVVKPGGGKSSRYMTNGDSLTPSCLRSTPFEAAFNVRLTLDVVAYEGTQAYRVECALSLIDADNGELVGVNTLTFGENKNWRNFTTFVLGGGRVYAKLECDAVPNDAILAIDNLKIIATNPTICENMFGPPSTTTAPTLTTTTDVPTNIPQTTGILPQTTTNLPPTTTLPPDGPNECKIISTSTSTTTTVTVSTIKFEGDCPATSPCPFMTKS